MMKLLLQLGVAVAVWLGLGWFEIHWGFRLVAILLGVVVVHQFWERLVFRPYDYLGAMPVAEDDPIMQQAVQRTRDTLGEFRKLYPAHRDDSMVKFRFKTDGGTTENLWGDLLEFEEARAKVYVRTPPIQHSGALDRTMEINVDDIVDWQIELRDGNLRGGFTNQALFKIFERQEGYMHPKFKEHMSRFQDGLEPGPARDS